MKQLYVPYSGKSPAPLHINGHRLILVARESELIETNLGLLGADHLIELISDTETEEAQRMSSLAQTSDSGVVILPDQAQIEDVIKCLEQDLPWIH